MTTKKTTVKKVAKKVVNKVSKPKSQKMTKKDYDEMFARIQLLGSEKKKVFLFLVIEEGYGILIQGKMSDVSPVDAIKIMTINFLEK